MQLEISNPYDGDRGEVDYWEKRYKYFKPGQVQSVFADGREALNTKLALMVLEAFRGFSVVDICCGYGRLAPLFKPENYVGIDFSPTAIRYAQQLNPGYKFICADVKEFEIPEADIIVEWISLGMLKINPETFNDKFKSKARLAVICLDGLDFRVFPKYEK